ncbi:MAG TPA: hypothetical protein EYG40_06150 [Verrucomicrobia bacterium]|nr:hypothetical protein [Verrucomicrobiales bacterium]HIL54602.1 hypothetical protein [Verrucomicrobiota bacterium]
MPEPSSENQPEEADLFSDEEANSLENLPASAENLDENENDLIIRKSKKTELDSSLNDTEEVNIYRGKGSDNEGADATYGELTKLLDSNVAGKELNDSEDFNLDADIFSSVKLPIGLVLEPLYQKERSGVKVKAGVFIAVSLFVFIVFLLWGGKNNESGDSDANLKGPSKHSAEHLLKPLVPIEGENTADIQLRVRDTLEKFFGATKKEELYGVIRKGDGVSDLFADYYSRNEFLVPRLNTIDSVLKFEDPSNFWIANITVQDDIRARSVILEDSDIGFLVDWEEFVRYSSMRWKDFIDTKSLEAIDFRVRATLDVNPGFAFPDRKKWICVRIDDWKSDDILFGYAAVGTELSQRIQKVLYDEWQKDCVLRLQFPEDSKGGINQVHILDLVNDSWVKFD